MKKLLIQLDTDEQFSVFDAVVAYDAGVDHVISFHGAVPHNVPSMVEGAIFTRAPKNRRNTAIFIGGSNMEEGEAVLRAVQNHFFADFRVSVMLDSNGGNTTAAAGVACISKSVAVQGKRAVILAGTGPVGQRAAAMLARDGAQVTLTSRREERALESCKFINEHFGVEVKALATPDPESRARAIADAQILFATGTAGVELIAAEHWQSVESLEIIADANATPPLGVTGIEMGDRAKERAGKTCWGALGFGALKLKLQRDCVSRLFDEGHEILNADYIYARAKELA